MNTMKRELSLRQLIYSDYRRYVAMYKGRPLSSILAAQGLWASFFYRISNHLLFKTKVPGLRKVARIPCSLVNKFIEIITGINLADISTIGEGLHIRHFGNIFVGAKIGCNCSISQGVSIGSNGNDLTGLPTIGDRVVIGPNAVIVGKIRIGNDVVIGPGAFVSRSIPDRAVVIGNPAQIVWYKGSFDLIRYDNMENDPERQASFACTKSCTEKRKSTTLC